MYYICDHKEQNEVTRADVQGTGNSLKLKSAARLTQSYLTN